MPLQKQPLNGSQTSCMSSWWHRVLTSSTKPQEQALSDAKEKSEKNHDDLQESLRKLDEALEKTELQLVKRSDG